MRAAGADFTNTFVALAREDAKDRPPFDSEPLGEWYSRWRARFERQEHPSEEALRSMRAANPLVIPRNHRVEAALMAATAGDLAEFNALLDAVSFPYRKPEDARFTKPSPAGAPKYVTYCGT